MPKKTKLTTQQLSLGKKVFNEGDYIRLVSDLVYGLGIHLDSDGLAIKNEWDENMRKTIRDTLSLGQLAPFFELIPALEAQCILKIFPTRSDIEYFAAYYQVGQFLKKFPCTLKGHDTLKAAKEAFRKYERRCDMFNRENFNAVKRLSEDHPFFYGMLDDLASDIKLLIGPINDDRVYRDARHGPGASIGTGGRSGRVTSFYKFSTLPYTVTADAYKHAQLCIATDPRWIGALDDWYRERHQLSMTDIINQASFWNEVLKVVPGSRITTVPKNYKTDRTIAIEPTMNVYLQLGVDGIIRRRLKTRWNYDIDDQVPNQNGARTGSLDNSLSTLDLSGASDTISLDLVARLLPDDWFYYLMSYRCHTGTWDDEIFNFAKFSSMGNGYTFALETLIFGAVVRWCYKKHFGYPPKQGKTLVYGDDIVVPTEIASLVSEVLEMLGFLVNSEKSFTDGPFRESCGGDYFHGILVTPVKLKRKVETAMDLFYIHNALWLYQTQLPWPFNPDLSGLLRKLRKRVPKVFRHCAGPPSESLDTYLFRPKRTEPIIGQRWEHPVIQSSPTRFSEWKYRNWFFLKLMARLKFVQVSRFSNTTVCGGNQFVVTRRGYVEYCLTKRVLYHAS